MIRLGMLDFDTSHAVEFTKRLNHRDTPKDQWVEGARVVLGCPGISHMAPERIREYTPQVEKLGVTLVARPEEMIGKIDGVLVESLDGTMHRERARPFLEAGLPCFIDKPFACSSADARALVDLAAKKKAALFSSSSLRYAPELVDFMKEKKHGRVLGAVAYGPAPLNDKDPKRNPGLFHYGIHAAEVLYTVMGPGCRRVTSTHEKDVDVVTGQWADGRVATLRGIRSGKADYGVLVFAEQGVVPVAIGTRFIYRELLKQVVGMFQSGKPPLDPDMTVELVGFLEAAGKSGANHGAGETVGGR